MVGIDRRLLQNVDWLLLVATGGLLATSAVTLGSLSVGRAGGGLVLRQLAWVGVGALALVVIASVDYRRLVRMAPALYVLGRVTIGFVLPIMAVPFVLIVKQPDLGTALLLFPVTVALLVGAGVRLRLLGALALAGVGALPVAWFMMKDYQRERIMVYLDPFRDPLGSAYNVIQAKIAIGSGQLLGKGIAGATQSRLAFLPERHTDFIFAVFAEMWGFVGCLILLLCYVLLLLRGFDIAATAREPMGRLVALGATALFAAQVLINVGMVTGLLPVVGIPLPLMSYGGSSMLVSLSALGLLLSVRMRQFQ